MARTALTPQTPTRTGTTVTFAAANADGHYFANDGRSFLRIKNTDGSSKTVTVAFGGAKDGVSLATLGKTITVGATTGDVTTAVWPKDVYDQADGTVYVDYSATTGVTIAVVTV
jgi:hypothetical protein